MVSLKRYNLWVFIIFTIVCLPDLQSQNQNDEYLLQLTYERLVINESIIEDVFDKIEFDSLSIDTVRTGWIKFSFLGNQLVLYKHILDENNIVRKYKIKPYNPLVLSNGLIIKTSTLSEVEEFTGEKNHSTPRPKIWHEGNLYHFERNTNDLWILSEVVYRSTKNFNKLENFSQDDNAIEKEFTSLVQKIKSDSITYDKTDELFEYIKRQNLTSGPFGDTIKRYIGSNLYQFQCSLRKYYMYGNLNFIFDAEGNCIYLSFNSNDFFAENYLEYTDNDFSETNEMHTIGFWCYSSGSPPDIINEMLYLVSDKEFNLLINWTYSYNVEKRIAGAIGLNFLRFKMRSNKLIPKEVIDNINQILSSKLRVNGCIGCFVGNYYQSQIVDLETLYDYFLGYKETGFIR